MDALSHYLGSIWSGVMLHLWQSTLVIVPLFVLAVGLRRAPARLNDWLWSLALVKLFLPLAIFGALTRNLMDSFINWFGETLGETQVLSSAPVVTAVNTLFEPQSNLSLLDILGGGWGNLGLTMSLVVLTIAWQVSLIWHVSAIARDFSHAKRLQGRPLNQLPAILAQRMQRVLERMGIPLSCVQFTDDSVMPAVIGILRPHIIVPRKLIQAMPDDELIAVLAHEDTHRRRHDPLRYLLLRLCRSLFFFYPLVYPVLKRVRENAEYACDEEALATGLGSRLYARALARSVRLALVPAPLSVAAGSGGNSLLRRRLARLREPERNIMSRYRLILVAAALLVAVGSFLPVTGGADTPPPPQEPTEPAPAADPGPPQKPSVPAPATDPEPPPPPKDKEAEVKEAENKAQEEEYKKQAAEGEAKKQAAGETFITKPKLVYFESPEYPESARKARAQGTVKVLVLVDEKGLVVKARVEEGVEGHPELDEAALKASYKCKFEPGNTAEGEPTKAWMKIPYEFKLK